MNAELLNSVTALVTALVGAAATWVAKKGHEWLTAKAAAQTQKTATTAYYLADELLNKFVDTAAGMVKQTVVDVAKRNGTWDDAAKRNAKEAGLNFLSLVLGADGIKSVSKTHNIPVDKVANFLEALLEAKVAEKK